ncbi:MAG: hypothetical protein AB7E05_10015 [Sphingobium sp.]
MDAMSRRTWSAVDRRVRWDEGRSSERRTCRNRSSGRRSLRGAVFDLFGNPAPRFKLTTPLRGLRQLLVFEVLVSFQPSLPIHSNQLQQKNRRRFREAAS